ncbi:MAG: sulfotransferase domain-containing protein [Leptolyngbyaceae cyanobacterium]
MRSGSTLQYQLTQTLVEKLGKGKGYGWLPSIQDKEALMQRATETDQETYYVVKIHGHNLSFSDLIQADKGRAIYVYRDIRDVVTSFMSWRNTSFESIIRQKWIEKVIKDSHNWESLSKIHTSKYESLMSDIPNEVLRIADHIGLPINLELAQEIADECSIDRKKKEIASMKGKQQKVDSQNILHQNHINSGKSRQWLKKLSNSKIAHIEQKAHKWLEDHDYEIAFANPMQRQILASQCSLNLFFSDTVFNAKRTKGNIDKYLGWVE